MDNSPFMEVSDDSIDKHLIANRGEFLWREKGGEKFHVRW